MVTARPGSLSRNGGRLRTAMLLILIVALGLLPRVPVLYNAGYEFSSDEAVNALVIKHLLERGEITLFNWDTTYYGIVEGLLAIPFVALLGFVPLAFKLAAVAGFVFLIVAVFSLGRRLYGAGEGLAAAALLAFFSPQLVQWSTVAAAGFCLIVAWGTLLLLLLDRAIDRPSPARVAGLGLLAGFGLYIYELFVVYLVILALWIAVSLAWRAGNRSLPPLRMLASQAGLFAAGFAAGWFPKLWLLLSGGSGSKQPSYSLAGAQQALFNVRLLLFECIPAFFGVNPAQRPSLQGWVGPPLVPGAAFLGALLLLAYAAAWLWGLGRARRELTDGTGLPRVASLLVALVPLTALLFALSPNPEGVLSNRFLLPLLSSLPVLAGGLVGALLRRSRTSAAAAALLLLLLLGLPATQIVAWSVKRGVLSSDLKLVRLEEPLTEVLAYLQRQDMRGAYGWYWVAYKATLLSGERVIVAPADDWDRYPPYTRYVDDLDRVAYIFRADDEMLEPIVAERSRFVKESFLNRVESAGRSFLSVRIGPYLVYHGRTGERLLLSSSAADPVPLRDPRAEIQILAAPATAPPGEQIRIPVRITNRSDSAWSAEGAPLLAGSLRIAAGYRWFDSGGRSLVDNPERSLLPFDLPPGRSLDMAVRARTPEAPGRYDLAITLVQENVAWFDLATGSLSQRVPVEIRSRAEPDR